MDKFFNLMYDFFSFALPGACIILSILLLPQVNNLLTNDLKLSLTTSSWQTF